MCSLVGMAQSRLAKGVVSDNDFPIPGVNVQVKSTDQSISTNFDGEFEIMIPEGFEILQFSFIGFETLELDTSKMSDEQLLNLVIVLEEDESVDVHYYGPLPFIGVGYYGGINNSVLGVQLQLERPFHSSTRWFLGYQNANNNQQLLGSFEYLDFFNIDYESFFSLEGRVNLIDVENRFDIHNYDLDLKWSGILIPKFNRTDVLLGTGYSQYNGQNNFGVSAGFKQGLPINLKLKAKLSYWVRRWQYQTQITWEHWRLQAFYHLNIIAHYTEHNLGLAYKFHF